MGSEEFSFKCLLLHPAWNLLAGGGVENREGAVGINKSRMQRGVPPPFSIICLSNPMRILRVDLSVLFIRSFYGCGRPCQTIRNSKYKYFMYYFNIFNTEYF